MRLHFQEKPYDLFISIAYATLVAAILLGAEVHSFFAVVLIFIAPGYVLVAALFPGNDTIDWMERIALSIALSIVVVSLVGFVLDASPWGMRFGSIVVALTLFTCLGAGVAYRRRVRLPREKRLAVTLEFDRLVWSESSKVDKVVTVALALGVVLAAAVLLYLVLAPGPGTEFTEFYILGPSGNASGYPTNLTVNATGGVIIGVVNHESAVVDYSVRIDLVGVRVSYNASSGSNETIEVNRTTWSTFNVTLANGQNWTQHYAFRINDTGLWKVEFLLFREGQTVSAYRELHLYVRVG